MHVASNLISSSSSRYELSAEVLSCFALHGLHENFIIFFIVELPPFFRVISWTKELGRTDIMAKGRQRRLNKQVWNQLLSSDSQINVTLAYFSSLARCKNLKSERTELPQVEATREVRSGLVGCCQLLSRYQLNSSIVTQGRLGNMF